LDKFDAQLESICAEVEKTWVSYSVPNLEAEIAGTVEAQKCVIAEIQSAAQETDNTTAKLHEEDHGKCNKLLYIIFVYFMWQWQLTCTKTPLIVYVNNNNNSNNNNDIIVLSCLIRSSLQTFKVTDLIISAASLYFVFFGHFCHLQISLLGCLVLLYQLCTWLLLGWGGGRVM